MFFGNKHKSFSVQTWAILGLCQATMRAWHKSHKSVKSQRMKNIWSCSYEMQIDFWFTSLNPILYSLCWCFLPVASHLFIVENMSQNPHFRAYPFIIGQRLTDREMTCANRRVTQQLATAPGAWRQLGVENTRAFTLSGPDTLGSCRSLVKTEPGLADQTFGTAHLVLLTSMIGKFSAVLKIAFF